MNPSHAFFWLRFNQPAPFNVAFTPGFGGLFVPANDEDCDL